MKVKELIKILKEVDPDRLVIMSRDSEGNNHSSLYNYWLGAYEDESPWGGNVGLEYLTEEDKDLGYTEDDVLVNGRPAIIFVPRN